MLLIINHKVSLQVIQVNSTGGYYYGLVMRLKRDSTNSNSTGHFYMSQSYFGRNRAGVSIHSTVYFIKLVNITVDSNRKALNMHINHGSVLTMENVNIVCNMGPLVITSSGESSMVEVMKLSAEKNNFPQNIIYTLNIWQILPVNRALVNLQFSDLTIYIVLRPCPLGFLFNNNSQTCVCHPKLQQHKINCSINTQCNIS